MAGQPSRRCSSPLHVGERVLPADLFHRRGNRWKSHCKACISAAYQRDKSKQQARNRRWYVLNGEVARKRALEWRRQNTERHRKNTRDWTARNLERARENTRRWVREHPERVRENSRRAQRKRRDYYRNALRQYRARKRNAEGTASVAQIKARWDYYGGKCWMCGAQATEMDHVKPVSRGGSNWPANLRPACRTCNARKGNR